MTTGVLAPIERKSERGVVFTTPTVMQRVLALRDAEATRLGRDVSKAEVLALLIERGLDAITAATAQPQG